MTGAWVLSKRQLTTIITGLRSAVKGSRGPAWGSTDTPPGRAWTPGPQSFETVVHFPLVGFLFLGRGLTASIKLPEGFVTQRG